MRNHTLTELWMSAIMLRALLSIWNYCIYSWRVCKFISIIYSVGYKTCYKIVIGERNITLDCLGTPMVGLQIASRLFKGHLNRAFFFLSLKHSDSIRITSPFALRPLCWGFWGPQQGNAYSSLNITLRRPRLKYQERSWMERELEELNGFFIIFKE